MVVNLHDYGHLTSKTSRPQQSHLRNESGVVLKHAFLRYKTKPAGLMVRLKWSFFALSLYALMVVS